MHILLFCSTTRKCKRMDCLYLKLWYIILHQVPELNIFSFRISVDQIVCATILPFLRLFAIEIERQTNFKTRNCTNTHIYIDELQKISQNSSVTVRVKSKSAANILCIPKVHDTPHFIT